MMNDSDKLTPFELAVEYGKHLFGVYPHDGEEHVTGLLHYDGEFFESYVDSGSWRQYPNWVREYDETPLYEALEAVVEGRTIVTTECSISHDYYPEKELGENALSGWQYRYTKKRAFRRAVLRGVIDLNAVAIINRYGDVYVNEDDAESVRETYWEFTDENKQSKTNNEGVKS